MNTRRQNVRVGIMYLPLGKSGGRQSKRAPKTLQQRAASLDLHDVIEFKEGDAETIDLQPSTFDAALCRWGLMLLPDPKAGLSNIN
jgi:ubiquinone/menaquinone biosynthesis C-methylase UbiE